MLRHTRLPLFCPSNLSQVEADWIPLETFNLPELAKLSTGVGEPTDLRWAGSLEAYDEELDRVSAKAPRKLKR